ncbi:Cc8L18.2-like protein [Daphnia magna]|uniref:Cc8L18.2-like protein n=1 Tax=Daphnia magna TaxID=35525 RepID=A0A164LFS8_9CRUS|nr:Cc8L18.2-like protein [Daphnia magna]
MAQVQYPAQKAEHRFNFLMPPIGGFVSRQCAKKIAGPSSVTQCLVGIHLKSACYLKRFVEENYELDTLDDLDDNNRKTVELRVNMSHVSSICKHHKVAFTTRFSLYHQSVKCSNIFGKPKSFVPTGNKIVTLANCVDIASKKPNLHINPGQRFCVTCHSQMYNSKVIDNPKNKSSSSSAMGDIDSALQEIGSDDAFSSPINSPLKELQKSILVTNTLDVTPVRVNKKKSKFRREPDIINKANQVRCAFIKLHSNLMAL